MNESLVEFENNYIGNIMDFNHAYVISYADISTGEIYTTILEHNISKVISEIVGLNIKEIVMNSKVDKNILSILKNQFKITVTISDEVENDKQYEYIYEDIGDVRYIETIKHLLTYITKTQKRSLTHLQKAIIK